MIRSMTGFGEAERDTPAGLLRVEIKTVNHRFFNANLRSPSGYDRYDSQLQALLRERIGRGHVNCTISLDRSTATMDVSPSVDLEKARQYKEALVLLKTDLELAGEVDLAQIARFGDLFRAPDASKGALLDVEVLEEAVRAALDGLVGMRETEGARMEADLRERLSSLAEQIERVANQAPERLISERDRLRQAIRELADADDIDEDRLAKEMAYLAEKWDINEEIVRFRSHLELFTETLDAPSSEAVGKRLGFVLQEMHREANTIGAKANNAEIAQASVVMKEEVERLREQLENIE
jgi:uncharacterized protein (TIGR00255 family)